MTEHSDMSPQRKPALADRAATRVGDLLSQTAAVSAHNIPECGIQSDTSRAIARTPAGNLLYLVHEVTHSDQTLEPSIIISATNPATNNTLVQEQVDGFSMTSVEKVEDDSAPRELTGRDRLQFLREVLDAKVLRENTTDLFEGLRDNTPHDSHRDLYLRDLKKVDPYKGLGLKEIQ